MSQKRSSWIRSRRSARLTAQANRYQPHSSFRVVSGSKGRKSSAEDDFFSRSSTKASPLSHFASASEIVSRTGVAIFEAFDVWRTKKNAKTKETNKLCQIAYSRKSYSRKIRCNVLKLWCNHYNGCMCYSASNAQWWYIPSHWFLPEVAPM